VPTQLRKKAAMNELEEAIKKANKIEDILANIYEDLGKNGWQNTFDQVKRFAQVAGALRQILEYLKNQQG